MAIPANDTTTNLPSVMPAELATAMFDEVARDAIGLSGEEFIRRYDDGEFHDYDDDPAGWKLMQLIALIPFGRLKP